MVIVLEISLYVRGFVTKETVAQRKKENRMHNPFCGCKFRFVPTSPYLRSLRVLGIRSAVAAHYLHIILQAKMCQQDLIIIIDFWPRQLEMGSFIIYQFVNVAC